MSKSEAELAYDRKNGGPPERYTIEGSNHWYKNWKPEKTDEGIIFSCGKAIALIGFVFLLAACAIFLALYCGVSVW